MAHTKLPLTTWFLAIYLISQAKPACRPWRSSVSFGVSYPMAWLLHQKINRAMATQDATHQLSGTVQLDDAYLGGERTGGKVGRGSENKVPFVAAVSVNDHGHPMFIKLNVVRGFTLKRSASGPSPIWHRHQRTAMVWPASVRWPMPVAFTSRWWSAPRRATCPASSGSTPCWATKTTLAGAFHALNYRKYAEHYLVGFAYRFNRRFDLRGLVASLIVDVVRAKPIKEKTVRSHAEARF